MNKPSQPDTPKPKRLRDIAESINGYLKKFETDAEINAKRPAIREQDKIQPFFRAGAWHAGRYVAVQYVSYQGAHHFTRAEAEQYLAWLEQGGIGKHYK